MFEPRFNYNRCHIYAVENGITIYNSNIELCFSYKSISTRFKRRKNHENSNSDIYQCASAYKKNAYFISLIFFVLNALSFSRSHICEISHCCSQNTIPLASIFEVENAKNGIRALSSGVVTVNNEISFSKTPVIITVLQMNNSALCTIFILADPLLCSLNCISLTKNLWIGMKSIAEFPSNVTILLLIRELLTRFWLLVKIKYTHLGGLVSSGWFN